MEDRLSDQKGKNFEVEQIKIKRSKESLHNLSILSQIQILE